MDSSLRGLILIIDPDPLEWTAHQRLLDCRGYPVCRARDLSSARQCASQFPLGMVLCQVRVDRYLAPELVGQVLQNQSSLQPAVMFLSKNQSPGVIHRNHPFGPAMHLSGSVGPAVFLKLVERLLGIPHNLPAPRPKRPLPVGAVTPSPSFFSPFPSLSVPG
ncbi:MAG: hypothetical protein VYE64_05265 [Planctomycetota bacterium]|nr:hypothetical protein [Planctomycetota bacterium]